MGFEGNAQGGFEPTQGATGPGLGRHAGVDFGRTGFGGESGDHVLVAAPAQDQGSAVDGEAFGQARETVMQPPARGTARGPGTGGFVIEDEERQHPPPGREGGVQGGLVGETQVTTKPEDDGGGVGWQCGIHRPYI